jgi:hypothetical protein
MSGILSDFTSGLSKFFTKDRLLIIVGFIVLAVVLMYYTAGKVTVIDNMDTKEPLVNELTDAAKDVADVVTGGETKKKNEEMSNKEGFEGYSTQDVANPAQLLPNDANSQWASLNPVSQSNPQIPDLLSAGYHIGLDTIGQTMKNANLQLRSDPVIQKGEIGPWNQSTIEPDLMRVPLEVGCKSA